MGFFGRGEVEDVEGVGAGVGGKGGEVLEAGGDGEAVVDDFFCREVLEVFASVRVGDEPVVGGGFAPGGIDLDGVGDDGDDGFAGVFFKDSFYKVGIEGVGGNDDVGLKLGDFFCKGAFGFTHKEGGFGEVLFFCAEVDAVPEIGVVGGDVAVGGADEVIEAGGAHGAGVEDTGLGTAGEGVCGEGFAEGSGGTVVAIAKAGGENEYFFSAHWRKSIEGTGLRRCGFRARWAC